MNQLFLTIREAAGMLCIAEKTARNWMTQGKFPIPTFKIGSRRVVRSIDLVTYADGLGSKNNCTDSLSAMSAHVQPITKSRGRPRKV